jgi:benzodiazapine receptor
VGQIASQGQLRMSFLRWALVTVPLLLFLGFLSGRVSNSGSGNPWFDALIKPDWIPPGWVFGLVWSVLYVMMGIAIAIILNARGAKGQRAAIGLFIGQLLLNLAWSPTFFAAHKVELALGLIVTILVLTVATSFAFGRIRSTAAWLLVPYMVWLCLATLLNYQVMQLNPEASSQKARASEAHIVL